MLRDPLDFLRDIEESCIRIADYTAGLSRDEVFTDKIRFDGMLSVSLIGARPGSTIHGCTVTVYALYSNQR